jgi:hypothetical protein
MKNKKLEKNLAVLSSEFSKRINKATRPIWYERSRAKNSDDNFIVHAAALKFPAYDETAPKRTARIITGNQALKRGDSAVVIGIGHGNTIEMLLEKCDPAARIICYEPFWFLIREAMTKFNFSKALSAGRLIICNSDYDLVTAIQFVDSSCVIDRWMLVKEPYIEHIYNHYMKAAKDAEELINMIQCNVGTVMGAGKQIAENDLLNIPLLIKRPGINRLKDKFAGIPAIVVSTGPSLAKNVHLLLDEKARSKFMVICVGQALRTLLGYGIRPDFACTVDFGEVNQSHFVGLEECGIPLIALNRAYSPIFQNWTGPVYVAGSGEEKKKTAADIWVDKGHVMQGGSVSHFALSLASYFGCPRIALIGQDLAYEGDRSHTAGTDSAGMLTIGEDGNLYWEIKDSKSSIGGMVSNLGRGVMVQGYYGKPVITNVGLQSFITAFSNMISAHHKKSKVFNCTEGGAKIPGARRMQLVSYLMRYSGKQKVDFQCSDISETWVDDIKSTLSLCDSDIEVLNKTISDSEKGIELADKMLVEKDHEALKNLLNENFKYSTAAHEGAKSQPLLAISIYKASREIASQLYAPGKHLEKDVINLEKRVERNKHILVAAKTQAKVLIGMYESVIKQLNEIKMGKENVVTANTFKPEYFDECLDAGNWHFVLSTWRAGATEEQIAKAKAMRSKAIFDAADHVIGHDEKMVDLNLLEAVDRAREIGQLSKNWKRALRMLRFAEKIDNESIEVRYGIASCLFMLGEYKESLAYYEKIIATGSNEVVEKEYALVKEIVEKDIASGT